MTSQYFKTFILCIVSLQTFAQFNYEIKIGGSHTLHSEVLGEDRTILIGTPDSYPDPTLKKKYPVIILLDGYAHFKITAGTVHFMSSSRNRNFLMPESIIVAIKNVDRERDFTHTKIKTVRKNTMGGGRKFLEFIENELIPYIDSKYRTEPHRTLVGHSLGGLLTVNAYMDQHSIFDSFIAIDPSIWWDGALMQAKVDSIALKSMTKRLFIATANQGEANIIKNKKKHENLFELLQHKTRDPAKLNLKYYEGENHRTVPLKAIYDGLKFVNGEN